MSYARAFAVGLTGVTGHIVEVEADLARGLPGLSLTGLPDTALNEARDRVRAALVNSGESWPNRRITINLLPATLPKHGSTFDLAIAAVLLAGAGALPAAPLRRMVLLGELGLDGSIRPVRGVLPSVLAAARAGITQVVVPIANAREAALVPEVTVWAAGNLRVLIDFARGSGSLLPPPTEDTHAPARSIHDLRDVIGQALGRRAMELAAAGGHHVFLVGPPGAGKTMLAQRLPGILPALSEAEALEATAVHSVAGTLPAHGGLLRQPPFQAPHHSASVAALVGGGSGLARPGAVSLAHRGVLFLDEAPEFPARALEALRQPLEDGYVSLARARGSTRFPAAFQLVLAANPCPCAPPAGDVHCQCPPLARRRYLSRLSGPLLDRVDLRVQLAPVTAAQLIQNVIAEDTATVAARVAAARAAAANRWATDTSAESAHARWHTNAEVPGASLRGHPWRLPSTVTSPLDTALTRGLLSARGYHRTLRLAWTVADLDGRARPNATDVHEALALRAGAPA